MNIQKSRFISHVSRTESEEEAQSFIQSIKKKHHSATHNCSAYIIGENDEIQKANDDGEPSGTAGIPMLEVLKKRNLKNTVVVVTRYFGGIKLGTGGLIRAYSSATNEGVNAVGIVKRTLMRVMHVTIDYSLLGKIENALRHSPYIIKDIHYLERVEIEAYVKRGSERTFNEWMTNVTNAEASMHEGEVVYLEEDVR